MSGRGAGTRKGQWQLRMAHARDVVDGWLAIDNLREVNIERNPRTERHLLRPFDLLVAARGETGRAALVPARVSRAVAGVTLLVVRPHDPGSGMGHFLWYYLMSSHGAAQMRRQVMTSTLSLLTARNLSQVKIPVPSPRYLDLFAQLVEASEEAHTRTIEAAQLQREGLRDALIHELVKQDTATPGRRR